MKNYLLIALAALLMSACNQKELADTKQQKDSLQALLNERDLSLNEFMISFNEVESNLDSVSVRQHVISKNSDTQNELRPDQKARINAEITAINNLMEQNRKKIAELNRKVKGSAHKNVELEKAIATLNNQLAQKDQELSELNAKLSALNSQVAQLQISVDTLNVINGAQLQTIAKETTALHTAFYVVGKAKYLEEAKIIDRKGGMLGMGKTSKLNGDFDNNKFTRIDLTQTTTIPVNSDMKFVTSHPSNSYTLDRDANDKNRVKNILITNPEKFWGGSKYLVILND